MKEFGSDFHYIEPDKNKDTLFDFYKDVNLYANGRQAIQALIYNERWGRIWMPDYFCYDITKAIGEIGIQICFYEDNPLLDDRLEINQLMFEEGDVLFRMNYFGLRGYRDNTHITVPVIEDHSHDLIGDWAINSNADWCITSLRKTMPIPEGGMLWSPKGNLLPEMPYQTEDNTLLVERRWKAMKLKKDYLEDKISDKSEFRKLFIETESGFGNLLLSPLTEDSIVYLNNFDIKNWYKQKQNNWDVLSGVDLEKIHTLKREIEGCNNFSYIILLDNVELRDKVRQDLISNNIFPAILWEIPDDKHIAKDISDRMLSITCDGRYSTEEIAILKDKIEKILNDV